jgi:hypothetical protein
MGFRSAKAELKEPDNPCLTASNPLKSEEAGPAIRSKGKKIVERRRGSWFCQPQARLSGF